QVWSVAPDGSGAEQKELSFPLTNPNRTDGQIKIHEPGMTFAPDGKFMVVSDTSTINGGGRLLILHNEAIALATFSMTSVTRSSQGVQLSWQAAGSATYRVQRATSLTAPASFSDISGDLTTTQFTDTTSGSGPAFYRVVAKP
ncbi:MAG TPA: hypothetical protein VNT26_06265, partial [Candidatus Sulfotelmatobacter sp.]|nr:hypothetical protein [Candidatus Sulfotelmatobacter sp.]